jgi:hypothetical protein
MPKLSFNIRKYQKLSSDNELSKLCENMLERNTVKDKALILIYNIIINYSNLYLHHRTIFAITPYEGKNQITCDIHSVWLPQLEMTEE